MYVTFCGKFVPNERGVVGYVKRIRGKSPAKWGVQMAGMNFQTRSKLIITVSGKINRIRNYDFKEYFSLSYMEKR